MEVFNLYTWGYIKDATLAKMDLEQDEANELKLINRFIFYANEAITQICSAVKPKRTFYEVRIFDKAVNYETYVLVDGVEVHNVSISSDGNSILDSDGLIIMHKVGTLITMPDDFIGFGDDVSTVEYEIYNARFVEECHDDVLVYKGYNQFTCYKAGTYHISYKARWITFSQDTNNSDVLDVPMDILECLPSYIAHQCYKIDDEYKSSVFRNEYEIFLARIDDTNFKTNTTFKIGGDW